MAGERFIKTHKLNGAEVVLRLGAVSYVERRTGGEDTGEHTAIALLNGRTLLVRETPEDLLTAAAEVTVRFVDDERNAGRPAERG
jgi:hypothetical protein